MIVLGSLIWSNVDRFPCWGVGNSGYRRVKMVSSIFSSHCILILVCLFSCFDFFKGGGVEEFNFKFLFTYPLMVRSALLDVARSGTR